MESTGAWESQAACVLHKIATAAALRLGQDRAQVFQTLLQELGVLGRSFRARAVLRRRLAMTDSWVRKECQSRVLCWVQDLPFFFYYWQAWTSLPFFLPLFWVIQLVDLKGAPLGPLYVSPGWLWWVTVGSVCCLWAHSQSCRCSPLAASTATPPPKGGLGPVHVLVSRDPNVGPCPRGLGTQGSDCVRLPISNSIFSTGVLGIVHQLLGFSSK